MRVWVFMANDSYLLEHLLFAHIETPFKAFASRTDPYQASFVRAA